jgi:hypothetical protein
VGADPRRSASVSEPGQGWVVKRLDALLGETLPATVGGFLEEMKTRHITNIEACERLAESLKTACYAAEVDSGYFDKDKE